MTGWSMDNLPPWIDIDALDEFVSMRNRIKKPLTPRAMVRLVNRLQALKDAGHDPNASLIQSADHYWQDCYAPRDMPIERRGGAARIDETKALLKKWDEDRKAATPPPRKILDLVRKAGQT